MKWNNVLLAAAAATIGGAFTFFATAKADGVPASAGSPALSYSGVLLNNGLPITVQTEVEVGLWTDQARGAPDTLLCSTGEGVLVTPDAFGTFSVELPDLPGEGQDGKSCLDFLRQEFQGTRPTAFVQVEVNGEIVSYTANGLPVDRVPVSGVPFAVESERTGGVSPSAKAELPALPTCAGAADEGRVLYRNDIDDGTGADVCMCGRWGDDTAFSFVSMVRHDVTTGVGLPCAL